KRRRDRLYNFCEMTQPAEQPQRVKIAQFAEISQISVQICKEDSRDISRGCKRGAIDRVILRKTAKALIYK
ncbi:MAG TPA: hypothetical protein VH000_01670, partial [Rhizomicrobium sp.]|nr:hypothetical protein [Rhizomicrobium sp.]